MELREKTARRIAQLEQMIFTLRTEREELYKALGQTPPDLEDTDAQVASRAVIEKNDFLRSLGLIP